MGKFEEAVCDWLVRTHGLDAVTVMKVTQDSETLVDCPTCNYEITVVKFTYLDSDGVERYYYYDGGFAELVISLTEV